MKIVFTGGGTGGHVYPAIALADALRSRAEILFIGTGDRLEAKLVPEAGYAFETVLSKPLQRGASIAALKTAAVNGAGIVHSIALLRRFQPNAVIATGGYVCFPVMTAAKILRTLGGLHASLALLEPNAQPGLTNRLLAPMADEVWGAFGGANRAFGSKYVQTGIPVRASLFRPRNRIEAARRFGLDPNRKTILAIGGSQGARSLNETVAALVTRRALPAEWQVLHVSGERDYEYMRAEEREPFEDNRVVLVPYLNDMADAYALCDIMVGRAGASTLGELAALGIASILVPYPFASDDHQLRNARAFESAGACVAIEDRDLNADALWWTLRGAMEPDRLKTMREAARSLAPGDPVATILARIDALASRRTETS